MKKKLMHKWFEFKTKYLDYIVWIVLIILAMFMA